MVIFHSYVSLPEGNVGLHSLGWGGLLKVQPSRRETRVRGCGIQVVFAQRSHVSCLAHFDVGVPPFL